LEKLLSILETSAGIIEGFLSPSALPPLVKFGTGILTGIAMYSYLFLARQEKEVLRSN
jgi:hypothetical protein